MKTKPKTPNWRPIQLPSDLVRDLEAFADSGVSRALGFTNKSQLAAFAIRGFLSNYSDYLSIYQLTDFSGDKIIMIDHEQNRIVNITRDGTFLKCNLDHDNYCNHIKFVLQCPVVLKTLKKFGYPDENNKWTKI